MSEWLPIVTAPPHQEVLVYRDDAGVFIAEYTALSGLLSDEEIECSEMSEDELHENDWWTFCQAGIERVSNSGRPTHWMPLPTPPEPLDNALHKPLKNNVAETGT